MKILKTLKVLILPFSLLYFFIIELRNFLYKIKILKTFKFKPTIISVGNITAGGTGKTPTVIKIAEKYLEQNKKVAIITRGYNRKSNKQIILSPNQTDFNLEDIGDEPFMIKKHLPNIWLGVGADRKDLILKLQKITHLDYIILDDGFQKLQIQRNLNILVIDATNPFSNGFVLPYGLLREPIKNINRADLILLTKSNFMEEQTLLKIENKIKKYAKHPKIIRAEYKPILENLPSKEKKISMITAIGNPKTFAKTLNDLGFKIENKYIFRDHHWFTEEDFKKINDKILITTEKDFVKLEKLPNILKNKQIYVLKMNMNFEFDQKKY